MAQVAHLRDLAKQSPVLRHSAVVRVTHWLTTVSFMSLLLSGVAILLAHPRLYWGETGGVVGPSLVDLPLPFVLDIPTRGPGRYLHFLAAWACVLTGLLYVAEGVFTSHFRNHLVPAKNDLAWKSLKPVIRNHVLLRRPKEEDSLTYNVLQRFAYLSVVFILLPLMIWTGLAMSPAVTSVLPALATTLGGQQSARTIHFFVACALVVFLVVHVVMVIRAGFASRVHAMITGCTPAARRVR